ncbi:hypothetical protein [Pseudoalteromonas xiamenensis]
MNSKKLSEDIEEMIAKAGLSKRAISNYIFCEIEDNFDDEDNMLRFYEKFKKKLKRETTNVSELKRYKEIILRHPSIRKSQQITPNKLTVGAIPESMERNIRGIAKDFLKELESESE